MKYIYYRSHQPFFCLMIRVLDDFFYSQFPGPFLILLETRDAIWQIGRASARLGTFVSYFRFTIETCLSVPLYYNPCELSDQQNASVLVCAFGYYVTVVPGQTLFQYYLNVILVGFYICGRSALLITMFFFFITSYCLWFFLTFFECFYFLFPLPITSWSVGWNRNQILSLSTLQSHKYHYFHRPLGMGFCVLAFQF